MTHVSDITNGASLEDCHTNFFALADLNGIRWRRLSCNALSVDPLEDPILTSYSQCLTAGILSVWRRIQVQKSGGISLSHDTSTLSYQKELWIFWYGSEPDFSKVVEPSLSEAERGSWEIGLSYECRTLLFKALHNLIERSLLSRGYTRLGKFFVEPQTIPTTENNKKQIAFALHFFIHGDSTVCASVDARFTSSIYLLDKCHVTAAQAGQKNVQVILSPYGLEGKLTGVGYKYSDPNMARFMNNWHMFYPHPHRKNRKPIDTEVPNIVEVLIGGVRMKYPTPYVFVTAEDHEEIFPYSEQSSWIESRGTHLRTVSKANVLPTPGLLTPPMSPTENHSSGDFIPRSAEGSAKRRECLGGVPRNGVSQLVQYSVSQDAAISSIPNKSNDSPPLWDYQDVLMDTSNCSKRHSKAWKRSAGCASNTGFSNTIGTNTQSFTSDELSYFYRLGVPFHRRKPESSSVEESAVAPKNNSQKNSVDFKGHTVTSLPQLHTPFSQVKKESLTVTGELCYSYSSSSDPIMPTLSPQPPVAKEFYSQDSGDDGLSSLNPDPTQFVVLKAKVTEEHLTPFHTSLLDSFEAKVNEKESAAMYDADRNETTCAILALEDRAGDVLEKPQLSKRPHEETDNSCVPMSGPLYDYRHLNSTLWQHPNAKRKCLSSLPNLPDFIKVEPDETFCDIERNNVYEFDENVPCTPRDPYEFTEFDETAPSGKGFRHKIEKDEKFSLPSIPSPLSIPTPITPIPEMPSQMSEDVEQTLSPAASKSCGPKFIREEDLAVSLHDLDNIFDTSSSDGEDNVEMPHTPSKLISFDEYSGKIELLRMYPTPPSLEQNAVPSPYGPQVGTESATVDFGDALKEEEDHSIFPFQIEEVDVWNPPLIHTFLESSKYDALTTWPFHNYALDEHLVYKPSWSTKAPLQDDHIENHHASSYNHSPVPYDDQNSNFYSQENTYDSRLILPNCEAVSPASSTPSYLNRNLHSIGPNSAIEVHPLIVNILLSDSLLNVYKDHNFDSCCLCVCNMNIRGSDAGINLPNTLIPTWNDEPQYKCTCAFSAVIHRHKSSDSGLFYEDELEVTGSASDSVEYSSVTRGHDRESRGGRSHLESMSPFIIDLLQIQCKSFTSAFSLFHKFNLSEKKEAPSRNNIELLDGCEVCFLALEEAKMYVENNMLPCKLDESMKYSCLHKWPYKSSPLPHSSHEMMLHLDSLKPLLQLAVHKKNNQRLWDVTYVVSGPLTWREFHRLAARGTEDQCEPQPIPSLLMGYAGEQIALSPFACNYWHKLKLEPHSMQRDVAYIVVAPEHESKLMLIKSFFQELRCAYESHNLGKHRPITQALRDGIMRVGKVAVSKVAEEPISNWFNLLENTDIANKLKIYARVCKHRLAPHLGQLSLDDSLFKHVVSDSSDSYTFPQSSYYSDTCDPSGTPKYSDAEHSTPESQSKSQDHMTGESHEVPAIVIYMVDPFLKESDPEVQKMITLGLVQSYADMLSVLPEEIKNAMHLQLIDLNSIVARTEKCKWKDQIKNLAFSVYSQTFETSPQRPNVKSLTGFGPAAARDAFLNKNNKGNSPLIIYKQPYILASLKDKQKELVEMFGDRRENCGILYCTYCLTKDRKYLLTCCTNDRGEFMETNIINIGIPNRHRRKQASVRRFGLRKLLDFILDLIAPSNHPWRIVIDRFGRLGHGELKAWASLLSRRSLHSYSKKLRELCHQCSISAIGETPSILSACLVSFGPDSALRIVSDQFTFDERFCNSRSKKCNLSTPEDATCTHILVFPTSATTQSSQATFQQEHIDPLPGGLGEDLFEALDDDDITTGDINDILMWTDSPQSGGNSPHHSQPSSPGMSFKLSSSSHTGLSRCENLLTESHDETLQLLQQPLALGYYVSTAKTGPLPIWFWSSCPQLQNTSPIFLKSALLINIPFIQQSNDDLLHNNPQQQTICHPLDSNYTTDVLRYVLEGYNALSWLALNSDFRDRRSCLPVHMQMLMQLYGFVEAIL
ncbi:mediator of RNA polymerase II transcription subunit 13 isoform X2 [Parasteatoda tepidariorum]|nr:mediator of RNA polymerase II transcription subunit 13-like isoform X2 [Parasteatoda tepidariorum]